MSKRTRSMSFFVDRDLKENPDFEKFQKEMQQKCKQLKQKRKFTGTLPLKKKETKFQIDHIKLKSVR